jgi:hypothetical protein
VLICSNPLTRSESAKNSSLLTVARPLTIVRIYNPKEPLAHRIGASRQYMSVRNKFAAGVTYKGSYLFFNESAFGRLGVTRVFDVQIKPNGKRKYSIIPI